MAVIEEEMDCCRGKARMDFERAREAMIQEQLRVKGISCPRVLRAMAAVPRERFVMPQDRDAAYEDRALPIDQRQTISQPYMVALMSQWLDVSENHTVLEIGTGSGYQAAVLALLARHVYTVERLADLSREAQDRLGQLGLTNVTCLVADGSEGYAEFAPFDRVIVTAAAPTVPAVLLNQLADQGRLVAPVGSHEEQTLTLVERQGDRFSESAGVACRFVPLIGQHGWHGESAGGNTEK